MPVAQACQGRGPAYTAPCPKRGGTVARGWPAGLMMVSVIADTIDTGLLLSRHPLIADLPMLPASNVPSESRFAARAGRMNDAIDVPVRDDFEIVSLAGRGTFADVWQVRDRRTGRILALKELRSGPRGRAGRPADSRE